MPLLKNVDLSLNVKPSVLEKQIRNCFTAILSEEVILSVFKITLSPALLDYFSFSCKIPCQHKMSALEPCC